MFTNWSRGGPVRRGFLARLADPRRNADGQRKHRTTIGERVFLGVDTMLRAPLTIGDDASTGAGAVVTRDVPAGKLAVGIPARIREKRQKPEPDESGT